MVRFSRMCAGLAAFGVTLGMSLSPGAAGQGQGPLVPESFDPAPAVTSAIEQEWLTPEEAGAAARVPRGVDG